MWIFWINNFQCVTSVINTVLKIFLFLKSELYLLTFFCFLGGGVTKEKIMLNKSKKYVERYLSIIDFRMKELNWCNLFYAQSSPWHGTCICCSLQQAWLCLLHYIITRYVIFYHIVYSKIHVYGPKEHNRYSKALPV